MPYEKPIRWTMLLCVSGLLTGCATVKPVGDFCDVTPPPFEWHTVEEIDATPARALRYIETQAAVWAALCAHRRHS